ncbi:MAG TPA: choice-of-anchor B family protein [Saprospiraceae bacterium]|nr:choice-of-anchor B family protein [Saprospiraceae bacterium]
MYRFLTVLFCFTVWQAVSQPTQMNLLSHWRDPKIEGSSAYNNSFNEAWGLWVNGREYAIIGSTFGTHFIDITDPRKPVEVARVKGAESSRNVVHRDYDDYKCYLYAVCDEGNSSLQIMDISQLPNKVEVVYDSNEFMTRVHNIYIDVDKGRLYTCAENTQNGFNALGVYDLSNPTKPVPLAKHRIFGDIVSSHVHDAFVRNDTAYLNCGESGFAVMDFKNAAKPKPIFTLHPNEYLESGYNHSGWLTPNGKTYVMADENWGAMLKVMDFSKPDQAKVVSYLTVQGLENIAIPHNPLVSCDYAYVAYYYNGLQVYNLKDPKNPKQEYFYPTSKIANRESYEGAWGTYSYLPSGNIVVADMQDGMFLIEGIEKPCNTVKNCNTINASTEAVPQNVPLFWKTSADGLVINPVIEIVSISMNNLDGKAIRSFDFSNQQSDAIELSLSDLELGFYAMHVVYKNGHKQVYKILL